MAIDFAEWQAIANEQASIATNEVRYISIEQDKVWEQFRVWVKEWREAAEADLKSSKEMLQNNGDYSHAGLMKAKVRVDIATGEVIVLRRIEEKILSYTQEPES